MAICCTLPPFMSLWVLLSTYEVWLTFRKGPTKVVRGICEVFPQLPQYSILWHPPISFINALYFKQMKGWLCLTPTRCKLVGAMVPNTSGISNNHVVVCSTGQVVQLVYELDNCNSCRMWTLMTARKRSWSVVRRGAPAFGEHQASIVEIAVSSLTKLLGAVGRRIQFVAVEGEQGTMV